MVRVTRLMRAFVVYTWACVFVVGIIVVGWAEQPPVSPGQSDDAGHTTSRPGTAPPSLIPVDERHDTQGLASWYGGKFQGRLTANGEVFDTNQLTAAHKTLPFGTIVKVINRDNGKVVVVRINDRGPFVENRVIDLSRAAADLIGITRTGVAPVSLHVMHLPAPIEHRLVQIGSFSVQENAYHLVQELRRYELPAEIETVNGGAIHRVVIRDVLLSELDDIRTRLADVGYSNVLVRRN